MHFKHSAIVVPLLLILTAACESSDKEFDASGTFEATEILVSAEATGKILELSIHEGDVLTAGQWVGYIDSTQLYLTKMQLQQSQKAILSGRPDIRVQLDALNKELDNALTDQQRIENLVKGGVASPKQLDDIQLKIAIIRSKTDALKSTLSTTTSTINEQGATVGIQLAQVEDQLRKCNIVNPVSGTVLTKFAHAFEVTAAGRPLYKIADISEMDLRAYVTADQYAKLKTGDSVKVSIDGEDGGFKTYDGKVIWISNKAEFTPKTIQTKDERANLVYGMKIRVKNDGMIKIGMYGEVKF